MRILVFLSFVFLISACKNTEKTGQVKSEKPDFESIAKSKFSKPYTKLYNASGTHVICYVVHKKTEKVPHSQLHFLVFNAKTNELIYEKTASDSKVKWLTDKRIEIKFPQRNPEISGKTEVYDVEKRKNVKTNSDL